MVVECIVCKNNSTSLYAIKNNFKLFICNKCGLIFVNPMPHDLCSVYTEDYFVGSKEGLGYANYDEDQGVLQRTFYSYLDIIERFSSENGKLLDVGAATGHFLQLAKQSGWESYGVEISKWAVQRAKSKDLDVKVGRLKDVKKINYFGVITFFDVIEHLPNPKSELYLANKLLKKGGLVVINTPDTSCLVSKLLRKRWYHILPPEHLVYFNPKNLSLLLANAGFEVLYITKISKRFTLQYILQTVANWQSDKFLKSLARVVSKSFFGRLSIPLVIRDTFFVVAKKFR